MDLVELHTTAEGAFNARVHAIHDDQWTAPTPCEGWDVRTLVNHMVYEYAWGPDLLGGATVAGVGSKDDGDLLGDNPLAVWPAVSRAPADAIAATPMDRPVNV